MDKQTHSLREEYVLSDALRSLIPPEIVSAMEASDKRLFMEKVRDARKSTWWIFEQVVSLVQADSGAYPSLQEAMGDLLRFLRHREAC
jgi:hypothetical protein